MKIFFKIKVTFIFALVANFAFSQDWTERLKITANERANNALFGASVAISGDFAIIGANQEKKDADNSEENILTDVVLLIFSRMKVENGFLPKNSSKR